MSFREPFNFSRQPPAVRALMAAHAGVYLLQWFFWDPVVAALGLFPSRVIGGLWLWQPFTYIFLHTIGVFGFIFFLIHMYILSGLGRDLEYRWGSGGFVLYYFACGLGGALVTLLLAPWAPVLTLGATTVILGLFTAFAVLSPEAQVIFYFMPMEARQLILLVIVLEILLAGARMIPIVQALGHLAGMGTGYLLMRSAVLDRAWDFNWRAWLARIKPRPKPPVNMELEVDRILDKVLKEGAGSLSRKEQELMQRYSKSRR